jgi:3'-phosphoadenosine 5'-phosphosulfate sulfotransferase (PAPS reductase)/FAD synthetase
MMKPLELSAQVRELVEAGALFAVNHSGGKDSQAMLIKLLEVIPASQMVVVHASLGDVEWEGALEHAQAQAEAAGLPFIVAKAVKSFLEMVEHRFQVRPEAPSWPSAANRQCTSDLKRGPIERELRRYAKERGILKIVNCVGIRAAESVSRAKAEPWKKNARNSVAGREWFDWLPIFELSTPKVFEIIECAGQRPHPAYAAGNQRLSCVFCIMGSFNDIRNGAKARPELAARFIAMEKRTGYTMHQSRKSLESIVNNEV